MTPLRLKKDAERRIKAGHLWIFSNDIDTTTSPLKHFFAGELIIIETHFGKPIAIGYINPQCLLCIRILTLNLSEQINVDFFVNQMQTAKRKRDSLHFEKYARMVFGESDHLPGIVIDQFGDVMVLQINTAGMEKLKSLLLDAAQITFQPKTIILKCGSTERKMEGLSDYVEIIGESLPDFIEVLENNCRYHISLTDGQKTGWFYDHRLNRQRIASYCHGKRVLDVFSYCGAFSIPCAKNAAHVIAIDRSSSALHQLEKNATLNKLNNIDTRCGDALELMHDLLREKALFDVIILDPPALIKRKKDIPAGEKMYQKFNTAAMQLLTGNGALLSASCSMHLSAADLLNCIRRAALNTQKSVSVIEHCHQGPDHLIHPAIAETNYLKGFIVRV